MCDPCCDPCYDPCCGGGACGPCCPPKRCKSRELRGGVLYVRCDCVKRNGLQYECPRSSCKVKRFSAFFFSFQIRVEVKTIIGRTMLHDET